MTDDWASRFRPGSELEEEARLNFNDELNDTEPFDEVNDEVNDTEPIEPVQPYLEPDVQEAFRNMWLANNLLTERVAKLEQLILNPPWLNDLNSNLQAVLRDNAAALVGANNQFMAVLARKMDEMEERLSSDNPSYTNILYSNPELFTEISQRPEEGEELSAEEEFTSKIKIAELVVEENPDLLVDDGTEEDAVEVAFKHWQEKEIKWSDFVKAAGGVKAASDYKNHHEGN